MKINLVDYTGSGHENPAKYAAAQLIFAKSTRLTMEPSLFTKILEMSEEEMFKELRYISNTIPSSQEFVHYTFLITGVSRAFTHQFVRTRTASFAQQTMRVLDVSGGPGWDYHTGPSIPEARQQEVGTEDTDAHNSAVYHGCMDLISKSYKNLVSNGVKVEDARGILPTNILTNIMVSMNMRTFVEMARKRSSPRTQGEYRDVLEGMKEAAFAVHPWLKLFVDRTFDKAAKDLDAKIAELEIAPEKRIELMKLVDLMRSQS
jgi:flavin-dependent thymidylate synthase